MVDDERERGRPLRLLARWSDYLLDLITATRYHPDIHLGGSTRASLALYRASQALALLEGRDYVVPDDVKRLARPVLAHRILSRASRRGGSSDAEEVIDEILAQTPIPA